MPRATIWAIESDNDAKVAKCLALKLASHLDLDITLRVVGKKAFSDVTKLIKKDPNALEKAVRNYLKDSDCVIFILDSDSPIRLERRRKDQTSAISQIERVINRFKSQTHLAFAIHELEAWLLVDGVGLCCFFAGVKNTLESRKRQQEKFVSLLKNIPGNTELIVEAEPGGKGPKEYLVELSEKIIRFLDPKISRRNLNKKKYQEVLSSAIAEYIDINAETLKRNASLQHFGQLLAQCDSK